MEVVSDFPSFAFWGRAIYYKMIRRIQIVRNEMHFSLVLLENYNTYENIKNMRTTQCHLKCTSVIVTVCSCQFFFLLVFILLYPSHILAIVGARIDAIHTIVLHIIFYVHTQVLFCCFFYFKYLHCKHAYTCVLFAVALVCYLFRFNNNNNRNSTKKKPFFHLWHAFCNCIAAAIPILFPSLFHILLSFVKFFFVKFYYFVLFHLFFVILLLLQIYRLFRIYTYVCAFFCSFVIAPIRFCFVVSVALMK